MNIAPLFIIGLPILLVLAVGMVASTRRLGFFLGVLASILLTPIGGLVLAIITGPRQPKRSKPRGVAPQA